MIELYALERAWDQERELTRLRAERAGRWHAELRRLRHTGQSERQGGRGGLRGLLGGARGRAALDRG